MVRHIQFELGTGVDLHPIPVSPIRWAPINYGNATLAGIPFHLIKRMQSVMNAATRLVRYDLITLLRTQLH